MGAGGDQIRNRGPRVTTFDQTFTDQHGVSTGAGVGQQIRGAAHTGFGDPDHVAGQPGRDSREAIPVDLERLEITRVDPDHLRPGLQRPVGFVFVVHLDERCHA